MINNPSREISDSSTPVSRAIWAALQTQTSNSAKNFITKMVKEETAEALAAGVDIGEFSVGVRLAGFENSLIASPLGRWTLFIIGCLLVSASQGNFVVELES